jgi:hypothetical protein
MSDRRLQAFHTVAKHRSLTAGMPFMTPPALMFPMKQILRKALTMARVTSAWARAPIHA